MKSIESKIPPSAIELEEAVIGAMMIDVKGLDEAISIIRSSDAFYHVPNQYVFQAIQNLYNAGNPIDLMTVSQQLRKMKLLEEVGGDFYLIQLTQKISSSAHIEYHSRILLQKYISRSIISFSNQIIALAYDESTDVFELMNRWQKEFDKVADYTSLGTAQKTFKLLLEDLKKNIERLSANTDEVQLVGVDTGFQRTNKYTGGYRNHDLVILAARPGMGKTAKVLKTAIANVIKGIPVGFISGEMSAEQLTARAVAIDTNFHLNQLMKFGFSKPEYFQTLQSHVERMGKYPLIIDDSGNMDITDVVIIAKLWVRKFDIKLLIIDYIQLMTDRNYKGNNRVQELSGISRRLKKLAKELNIPVIALAQVNRDCEKRGANKRPLISDIKDCGAIEQDADIIEFIYRPEYYKFEIVVDDYPAAIQHLISMGADTEIIYAKYRGGSTGTTLLKWIGDKTKFVDVEDYADMNHGSLPEVDREVLPTMSAGTAFDGVVNSNSNDDTPY